MRVYQRDIVEVNFLFPDGKMKPHMAVVVSNDELNEDEGFFISKSAARLMKWFLMKLWKK